MRARFGFCRDKPYCVGCEHNTICVRLECGNFMVGGVHIISVTVALFCAYSVFIMYLLYTLYLLCVYYVFIICLLCIYYVFIEPFNVLIMCL
jgi:hypothetical protein